MRPFNYYFLLLFYLPLIGSGQILDKSFISQTYKYIDYTDESKSYVDENNNNTLIINLIDAKSGTLKIIKNKGNEPRTFELKSVDGLIGENLDLWIYERSLLSGIESQNEFYIAIFLRESNGYGVIIKEEGKTLEQYSNLKILDK